MKRLKYLIWGGLILLYVALTSCSDEVASEDESTEEEATIDDANETNGTNHEEEGDYVWEEASVIEVTLSETTIGVEPATGSVDGSTFTITSAGTYRITGTLRDGTIIVDTDDDEIVRLILNGVEISSSTTAPINVVDAEKVILISADNTINILSDGVSYVYPSSDVDEPNAAIFSTANLTLWGKGELMINGNYNDGICSKDGLIIRETELTVTAADDAIRGKDYIIMKSGSVVASAKGDGLKSDNDEDDTFGFINIEGALLNIISGGDAINAQTDLLVSDGIFNLVSGGGSSKSVGDNSAKALKAGVSLIVDNGEFVINSADDAVHSNSKVVINGGSFEITSGDDGIHADESLTIAGGDVLITKSYEGIESAAIIINGGTTQITADDDGVNVAGGADASGWGPQSGSSSDYFLNVNGGYVYVNSKGDGVDVNGSVVMTNGTIIVSGPTANNNAALDYDGSFKISGGFILATGSSGMAQIPGSSSTQNSLLVLLSTAQTAGTLVHLQDSNGNTLFTFKPAKQFQSIAFSSAALISDASYSLYTGGSATGSATNGLYADETYVPGTLVKSFVLSGVSTQVGSR